MDTLTFASTATRSDTVAPGGEARGCADRFVVAVRLSEL
jgi:hypothetical protein